MRFVHVESCGSTQDLLRKLDDGSSMLVVRADRQTSGRGRRGRTWESPEGGLYASLAFTRPENCSVSLMPLAAAQCWRGFLEDRYSPDGLEVKWPNDLLLQRGKLGGFLGEARNRRVFLGMGLNVHKSPGSLPEPGRPPAILSEYVGSVESIERLLRCWCEKFAIWLEAPERYFEPRRLQDSLRPIGEPIRWDGGHGRCVSLTSDGGLVVDHDGQSRTFYADDAEEVIIDETVN